MNVKADFYKKCLKESINEISQRACDYALVKDALTRCRKWSCNKLITFILSFGSKSLGNEILDFFQYSEDFPSVSSFVQLRQKLDYGAIEDIFHLFLDKTDQHPKLYKNYRLLAIDGSDLSLPYNPSEKNVIGENHFSSLHLNVFYDVYNKLFLDAIVQKGTQENEIAAACEMIDRMSEKFPIILLADRGYEGYNLFAHVEERLFDYVIRIRDSGTGSGIAAGMNLPLDGEFDLTKDVVITRHSTGPAMINREKYKYHSKSSRFDYIENSKEPDYEMTIRFVRFQLPDGNYELIASSLCKEIFSLEEIKELYHLRWGIETGFREVKYILGMEAFHSKKSNSIIQEIYARIIMYNYSMLITKEIKTKEKDLKHHQQVNFTQAIRICLAYFRHKGNEPPFNLETILARFLLPVRPNRSQPRETVSACVVPFNYRLS